MKIQSEFTHFHSRKCTSKCRLRNGVHLFWPQCVKTDGLVAVKLKQIPSMHPYPIQWG